jgi:uncharacterized membrane protein YraQ (UPF0718 family)
MKAATITMAVLLAALVVVALIKGAGSLPKGLQAGGKQLLTTLPLLILAFLIAGMIEVLVPREFILRWLGPQAGIKGVLIGSLAGGLMPGGPYISFPVVASLYQAGASLGTVVAFISAWLLWSATRFPLELGILGWRLAVARYVTTFIVPPLAGLAAQTVFGRWA